MVFGLFGKKNAPAPAYDPVEAYRQLIMQVAEVARARIYDAAECPRSIDRVVKAEDAVEARRQELAEIEAQLGAIEASTDELRAQVEAQRAPSERLVERWKKPVEAQLKRVKEAQAKLRTKQGNHKYAQAAIQKEEMKLQDAIESNDVAREGQLRQNNKRLRLDLMKSEREISDLVEEIEKLKYPRGVQGEDAIHARMRILELEDQLEQAEEEQRQQLEELDAAASAKEEEIKAADDFLAEALYLFGEDVFNDRFPDDELDPLYGELERAAGQLPEG